jgi:hypothetical protein
MNLSRVCLAALCVVAMGCKRKHVPVASVPELPYPSCDGGALPPGELLASGSLRAGPNANEPTVVERFELRQRDCLVVLTGRQEWLRQSTDVEVVYDRDLLPLRAWKRMTIPGVTRADGNADIRRYELRGPEVTITRRVAGGARTYEILRGERPTVVLGPGRGTLTPWLRRARLQPGGAVREHVLDMRELLETLRPVTLRRDPDLYVAALGRTVRVYTVYGRESVFADEHDTVIGDLGGMLPSDRVSAPAPAPMPLYGVPDPLHTP